MSVFNQLHLKWFQCETFPLPTFPCAHNQVFILFPIKEAQGLLGSSKSWILGQGRGCAWDILLFLGGNVALNKHFLKKGID